MLWPIPEPPLPFAHYLEPLLAPRSIALVGASEREGSLARIVHSNLVAGGLHGALYAVNPGHREVFGRRAYASLLDLPQAPDMALIATPARTVPKILEQAGVAGIKAAVVLSSGFGEADGAGRALQDAAVAAARRGGVRVLGPNCLGVMRPGAGVNATFARTPASPGHIALLSQSGAVCGAMLDGARSARVGFSSVISLGGAADVDFGEVLDYLAADGETAAILLYIEGFRDARRALSALRAAARVKPIIALKVGRYASGSRAALSHTGALVGSDEVFEAALRRSGVVRVKTYAQLFAAARALSAGRFADGNRLAVVTNGGGPGVLAADAATERGLALAELTPAALARLDTALPPQWSHGNPVDLIGDAPAARFGEATAAVLADPAVDACLAIYSPVAVTEPGDAAQAVAAAARGSRKPVLAAWLAEGAAQPLEEAGIPVFATPEDAVDAFSFLCAYRTNQAQLLEVPTALTPDPEPQPDLRTATMIRDAALAEGRTVLLEGEAKGLLAAFGLPVPRGIVAATRDEAMAAAREIGFPVAIKIVSPDITHKTEVGGVRLNLQNGDMVASAYEDMLRHARAMRSGARIDGVLVQPMLRLPHAREVLIGVATDPVFGPVISFGSGGVSVETVRDAAVALPPLNGALARDLMERTRVHRLLGGYRDVPRADVEAIAALLCGVSRMVCALPWLKELDLNPVLAHPGGAVIADARVVIDPARLQAPARYGHMAIHPYPSESAGEIVLLDGARVPVRAIRPEDAPLEKRFFDRLSERSRYFRFMQHLHELPPKMLARFTQLDYEREMALVVLDPASGEFIGVGRYMPNADGTTAEFALTVADAWQGKGIGRALLERLAEAARAAGYRALYGHILDANREMRDLASRLGCVEESRTGADVTVVRRL
jgi:acetyltransferase